MEKASLLEITKPINKLLYKSRKFSNDKLVTRFIKTIENFDDIVRKYNNDFANLEAKKYSLLFDDIDGKSLDARQRRAVVVDEKSNLVLAGAGSGKTLTIAAKTKYLVDTKRANPNEILLIKEDRNCNMAIYRIIE